MPGHDDPADDNSSDAITQALLTASRLLLAISAQSIANVDETLTIPQFRTMAILSTRGPVNLATLAGLLDVAPSTTGRMADRLVAAGLIDRQPHPDSRRELVVELTARGLDMVAAGHRTPAPSDRRGRAQDAAAGTAGAGPGADRLHDRGWEASSKPGSRQFPCLTT